MTKEIKIQETEFKGHKGVDIRTYLESPEFTGPTQKGVWVPQKEWNAFKEKINNLKVSWEKNNGVDK